MVAYCIGITNIDPIKYNLLFERFLNPDRKSMPDIDTDFDDEGRQKVIDYVVEKYGKNQVAQIITYGTMAAKMSIKDVARVMDLPLADSNMLAKLVPERPGISLKRVLHAPLNTKEGEKSLEEKEDYRQMIASRSKLRQFYNGTEMHSKCCTRLKYWKGRRNTGIHAAALSLRSKTLPSCCRLPSPKIPFVGYPNRGSVIEEAG